MAKLSEKLQALIDAKIGDHVDNPDYPAFLVIVGEIEELEAQVEWVEVATKEPEADGTYEFMDNWGSLGVITKEGDVYESSDGDSLSWDEILEDFKAYRPIQVTYGRQGKQIVRAVARG